MGTVRMPIRAFAFMAPCFFISLFVGANRVPNSGLSMLILLPLAFTISILLFYKEYTYCRDSFGLIVLYFSSFIRYIITPLLIVLSHSTVSTIHANDRDFTYAVFIEVFELIITMLAIRYIWPSHLRKKEDVKRRYNYNPENMGFRLSWIGIIFVVLLVALIITRGHLNNIISHLSTWFNRVINRDPLYNYDMMAFNIVKTVLFLTIVSAMRYVYDRINVKKIPVLIALAAGLMNTMFFEYKERTDLAVLVIASFFVLGYAFPKEKKILGLIFGVGGIVLVSVIFMEGTLFYEIGTSVSTVNIADYSKVAELYTTGPSVLANLHMNYQDLRSQVTLTSFAKELVQSCDLFSTLPFLRFVLKAVSSGRYSVEIYVASIGGLSYIIPNHYLVAMYVGDILSWLFEPLIIVLNIKLLGWFERTMFKISDLMQVYAVISIVTMVATGVFCNNFTLMLHSFSSLPLWLLIFSYVNNLGWKFKLRGTNKRKRVSYE